jgi:hypothetical protein
LLLGEGELSPKPKHLLDHFVRLEGGELGGSRLLR